VRAGGDVVITIDADLQNDLNEIPRLLAKIEEEYGVVSVQGKVKEITLQSPKLLKQRIHRVIRKRMWTSRVIIGGLAIGIAIRRWS
jgi:hypothetical protein